MSLPACPPLQNWKVSFLTNGPVIHRTYFGICVASFQEGFNAIILLSGIVVVLFTS